MSKFILSVALVAVVVNYGHGISVSSHSSSSSSLLGGHSNTSVSSSFARVSSSAFSSSSLSPSGSPSVPVHLNVTGGGFHSASVSSSSSRVSSSSSTGSSRLSSQFQTNGKSKSYNCSTGCNAPGLQRIPGTDLCCPVSASVTRQSATVNGRTITSCQCHENVSTGRNRVHHDSKSQSRAGRRWQRRRQRRPNWWKKN